jgi:UDPglucose 6-dehydrogenase
LIDTAKKSRTSLSVVNSVINSNEKRSEILLKRIKKILKNKIKNKKITFLGVTFKANTDDMRESACLKMIPYLNNNGAFIRYYDPTGQKREFNKLKNVEYKNNIKNACELSDLIIIHTEWNEFKLIDLKRIVKKRNFAVYDMRNIYSPEKMKKLNIKYFGIGR